MRIDIWSDVICPWCYLGHARLDAALEQLEWDDVDIHWRAFQLDPRSPVEPGNLEEAIERKYGPGSFKGMSKRLSELGAAEGLDYRFDLAQRVNTFDAHRLIAWAGELGTGEQDRLARRLFLAYFTEGENVADHDTLTRIAGEAELDAETAAEVLDSKLFANEVQSDQSEAHDRQVTGVPAFVIDGKAMIPGAQEVDTMVRVLQRARDRAPTG
jgi:predicted DsbA family dithiol-disulfide isomerase